MLKENKYRKGINDRPLTASEYTKIKNGGTLYKRVVAPKRSKKEIPCKKNSRENIA